MASQLILTERAETVLLDVHHVHEADEVNAAILLLSTFVKAPGGTVKEGELEKEKGKLIWSFDITTPDAKDITEVNEGQVGSST